MDRSSGLLRRSCQCFGGGGGPEPPDRLLVEGPLGEGAGVPDLPRRIRRSGGDQEERQAGAAGLLDRVEKVAADRRLHGVRLVHDDHQRGGTGPNPCLEQIGRLGARLRPFGGGAERSQLDSGQAAAREAGALPQRTNQLALVAERCGRKVLGSQPQVPGASGDVLQQHRLAIPPRPVEQDALRGSGSAGELTEPRVREGEFRFPARQVRRHLPRPRPERIPALDRLGQCLGVHVPEPSSPWTKQDGIRSAMTSRLTASFCVVNRSEYARYASRFAPCQPGASPASVFALLHPRTARRGRLSSLRRRGG